MIAKIDLGTSRHIRQFVTFAYFISILFIDLIQFKYNRLTLKLLIWIVMHLN